MVRPRRDRRSGDRPADLRRRLRQHPHRLAPLPGGPGAGTGDRPVARPGGAVARPGLQARLRAGRVQPEVLQRRAELASASIHVGNAIREVYATWLAAARPASGQLPVVACTGAEPMKDKYGTNYKPRLELVRWVDRPAQLPDASPVEPHEVWQGAAAAPPPRSAPPPSAAGRPARRTRWPRPSSSSS